MDEESMQKKRESLEAFGAGQPLDKEIDSQIEEELRIGCVEMSLFTLSTFSCMLMALIAPFLPQQFADRGLEQVWMGRAIAAFAVTFTIFSPIVGYMMTSGRRMIIIVGCLMLAISSAAIAVATIYINDKKLFLGVILVSRAIEGLGVSMICTTTGSICATFYPKHMMQMIGYNDSVVGIGVAVGPILGSFLYGLGHKFLATEQQAVASIFYVLTVVYLIFAMLVNFVLPPHFDKNTQATPAEKSEDDGAEQPLIEGSLPDKPRKNIGYCDLFCDRRYMFAALSAAIIMNNITFMDAIFSLHMKSAFHLDQTQIGLAYSVTPVIYALTLIFFLDCIPQNAKLHKVMMGGIAVSTVACLLMGPSKFLHLPNQLWLSLFGFAILGISMAFVTALTVPEMIATSMDEYPEHEGMIADYSSAIYMMMSGVGSFCGPLISSWLTQNYGFRFTFEMLALFNLFFTLLYFLVVEGGDACCSSSSQRSRSKQENEDEN